MHASRRYDLGALLGGVLYAAALDHLGLSRLLTPLACLLALTLLWLPAIGAHGPLAFGACLLVLGTTFGGLELIASGSAAGCVVDGVGGLSQGTLPAIIGAINGFGSLASMAVMLVLPSMLDLIGWSGLFHACAGAGGLAALVLLRMRPEKGRAASKGGGARQPGGGGPDSPVAGPSAPTSAVASPNSQAKEAEAKKKD